MKDVGYEVLLERLAQAERALERSERLAVASRYAGAIMHEVNNPLEAITNLVYLTKVQKDSPKQVLENMLIVEKQLETLGRVTSQALTFQREQKEAKDFDLIDIAESALKLHADKLTRHGVTVDRRLRGPALACVYSSEIFQVLSNLILNAIDSFPTREGRICLSIKAGSASVHVTISDNGPGIPDEFAIRLFEPYVTSKSSGTGLGLWLSKRIITKHGGTLRFRTSQKLHKSGTSFRITLPATKAA
jgi:signal transduction histidine kinase